MQRKPAYVAYVSYVVNRSSVDGPLDTTALRHTLLTAMTRSITATLATALLIVVAAGVRITSQTAAQTPADLVLRNGRIVTLDERMPEAQAIAAQAARSCRRHERRHRALHRTHRRR